MTSRSLPRRSWARQARQRQRHLMPEPQGETRCRSSQHDRSFVDAADSSAGRIALRRRAPRVGSGGRRCFDGHNRSGPAAAFETVDGQRRGVGPGRAHRDASGVKPRSSGRALRRFFDALGLRRFCNKSLLLVCEAKRISPLGRRPDLRPVERLPARFDFRRCSWPLEAASADHLPQSFCGDSRTLSDEARCASRRVRRVKSVHGSDEHHVV